VSFSREELSTGHYPAIGDDTKLERRTIIMALDKPTKEQIEEGLKLLAKKYERDEKVKKGLIKGSYKKSKELEARKLQYKKYAAKQAALRKKIADMKITVSPAEVDAQMKK
jgi:hypothetical protein